MAARETENNAYEIWGVKQRALWYVMVVSKVGNSILPKDRTRIAENTFKFSPARSWNELPTDYRFQRSTVD